MMRCGIRLPVLKAAIFDVIRAAGDIGASKDEILDRAYADRRRPSPESVKSHINQLNDMLVETDVVIIADSKRFTDGNRWQLVRRRP
jgi:hypothetical protein